MPKPELTKRLIADTLKKLVSEKRLDKISVSEIVEAAGLNRQTFYYHFQDKQELVCWIFDFDVSKLTDKNQNDTLLDDIMEYIYSEKTFYIDALTSEAQNNLRGHIYTVSNRYFVNEIHAILGGGVMDEQALGLFAGFFTNGLVGSLTQWAQGGMKTSDMRFIGDYVTLIKEQLVFSVNRYMANTK